MSPPPSPGWVSFFCAAGVAAPLRGVRAKEAASGATGDIRVHAPSEIFGSRVKDAEALVGRGRLGRSPLLMYPLMYPLVYPLAYPLVASVGSASLFFFLFSAMMIVPALSPRWAY